LSPQLGLDRIEPVLPSTNAGTDRDLQQAGGDQEVACLTHSPLSPFNLQADLAETKNTWPRGEKSEQTKLSTSVLSPLLQFKSGGNNHVYLAPLEVSSTTS